MDVPFILHQLRHGAGQVEALVKGVGPAQARWKPDQESWSILEVVNHLADEEVEDFRARLEAILMRGGRDWPAIDPAGWVVERNYNARPLDESLQRFLQARRQSLRWLEGLQDPDWEAAVENRGRVLRAGDVLAAWAAHDLLHMRQLVELHYAFLGQGAEPYSLGYAGPW